MAAQAGGATVLGFLTVEKTDSSDGFLGAMMVTDEHGYPLEFRATTPVRPTAVQRVLYGNTLEPFVSVELCGTKLLEESQRKPPLVLVSSPDLLKLSNNSSLVIAIRRAGEAIKVESAAEGARTGSEGRIESSMFQPVVYETNVSQQDAGAAATVLEKCFREFDLIETFDRMRAAIKLLGQEDPRFR